MWGLREDSLGQVNSIVISIFSWVKNIKNKLLLGPSNAKLNSLFDVSNVIFWPTLKEGTSNGVEKKKW